MNPIAVKSHAPRPSFMIAWALVLLSAIQVSPARGQYLPLTVKSIQTFWQNNWQNPSISPEEYIQDVIRVRRVAFLPTYDIRRLLFKKYHVPLAVVDSLRDNPAEQFEFKFIVYKFKSPAGLLSDETTQRLAEEINTALATISSDKTEKVFGHRKLAGGVGKGYGPEPVPLEGGKPIPTLMHITGRLERDGAKLKATVDLEYRSDYEKTLYVGRTKPVGQIDTDTEGLQAGARRIVDAIWMLLKQEIVDKKTDAP